MLRRRESWSERFPYGNKLRYVRGLLLFADTLQPGHVPGRNARQHLLQTPFGSHSTHHVVWSEMFLRGQRKRIRISSTIVAQYLLPYLPLPRCRQRSSKWCDFTRETIEHDILKNLPDHGLHLLFLARTCVEGEFFVLACQSKCDPSTST